VGPIPNSNGNPRRVCISSCFAIRDGATGKSLRDGWDLFQWEPLSRPCLATFCHTWTFIITKMRGKDALHSNGEYLRLDVVHAAALRTDAVSIVNGNECGRFPKCRYKRF
jgi:hypothetical protein